jgi:hypothetical protein
LLSENRAGTANLDDGQMLEQVETMPDFEEKKIRSELNDIYGKIDRIIARIDAEKSEGAESAANTDEEAPEQTPPQPPQA